MLILKLINLVVIFCVFSCAVPKTKLTEKGEQDWQKKAFTIVQKHWNTDEEIEVLFNESKDFVLCSKKLSKKQPSYRLQMLVIEIASESVIYENSLQNGQVAWEGKYWLKIHHKPEMVKKDEKTIFWYHVKDRKKSEEKPQESNF
jgi:hypothetical protein